MSQFRTDEQVEFVELYARLEERGLKAVDVARRLKITAPAISMLRSGKNNPHPSTLEDLRNYVREVCLEPDAMHDLPSNDLELWRGRARRAERELADIKNGLRDLLARSSSAPAHKTSTDRAPAGHLPPVAPNVKGLEEMEKTKSRHA